MASDGLTDGRKKGRLYAHPSGSIKTVISQRDSITVVAQVTMEKVTVSTASLGRVSI